MGVLDKFLDAMRLNSEEIDDDYEDDGDEFYDDPPEKIKRMPSQKERKRPENDTPPPKKQSDGKGKITQMRTKKIEANGMEICVIKPRTVDDTREITDTLLSNRPVVLNVEGLDIAVAQRIIDFAAGSCYAINGNLQKITNYIIMISPSSVDISGDFLDNLASEEGPLHFSDFHTEF